MRREHRRRLRDAEGDRYSHRVELWINAGAAACRGLALLMKILKEQQTPNWRMQARSVKRSQNLFRKSVRWLRISNASRVEIAQPFAAFDGLEEK